MPDNKALKVIYSFFLGLLLAIFVGVGISTFYPSPKMPIYPESLAVPADGMQPTQAQKERQQQYDRDTRRYQDSVKPYNRNVSIITLAAAVVFVVSVVFERRISLLADGIMLGGLFTLIYSLGRGFASEDSKYLFVAVSISLAVVIYLGYHRFARPATPKLKTRSRA